MISVTSKDRFRRLRFPAMALLVASLTSACSFSGEKAEISDFSDPGTTSIKSDNWQGLELRAVAVEVPPGQHMGSYNYDVGCIQSKDLNWKNGLVKDLEGKLKNSTFNEFKKADLRLSNDPNKLFEDQGSTSPTLRLAGSVTSVKMNLCRIPNYGAGYRVAAFGESSHRVLWRVFDTTKGKVVYEATTECASKLDEPDHDAIGVLMRQTFEVCVRRLIANPTFRDQVLGAS